MTDNFIPYGPSAAAPEPVVPRQLPVVTLAGILVVALVNTALGALDYESEFTEYVKWGVYASEYLLLSIWFAWGLGGNLRRFTAVAWIGIMWMLSSWIGFGIAHPKDVFSYTHEQQQMFTIMPLAIAISSIPLWIMRNWKWGFHHPSTRSRHVSLIDPISISAFALTTLYCFHLDPWVSSDLIVASIIGVLLGMLGLTLSPLLTLAFLGKKVHISFLIIAMVCMSAPGLAFASVYPVAGAGAGVHHAFLESIVASSSAFIALTLVFVIWRTIGIRHVER